MSKDLSVGDLGDDNFISILVVKNITKVSHMKGYTPAMNDFGSNNLVP